MVKIQAIGVVVRVFLFSLIDAMACVCVCVGRAFVQTTLWNNESVHGDSGCRQQLRASDAIFNKI